MRSNELGLIGSIIGGVCTIIATLLTISATSRRQKRELRYQGKGSGMAGFLLPCCSSRSAPSSTSPADRIHSPKQVTRWYPQTSPTALPTVELTTLPAAVPMTSTEAPITLEQASDFVSSYLACIFDHDDFTIVRVNGVLKIADATTDTAVKC